jgi:hypothetical protein
VLLAECGRDLLRHPHQATAQAASSRNPLMASWRSATERKTPRQPMSQSHSSGPSGRGRDGPPAYLAMQRLGRPRPRLGNGC